MSQPTLQIALFPLPVFLLPGETTRLFIFEERYKQLIEDCRLGEQPGFGLVFGSGHKVIPQVGSLVTLTSIDEQHPNGELDIKVTCRSVFRLRDMHEHQPGKMYPGGSISLRRDIKDYAVSDDLKEALQIFAIQSVILRESHVELDTLSQFEMASILGLSDTEKIELAFLKGVKAREKYLNNYLRYLQIIEEQEARVQEGIYLN